MPKIPRGLSGRQLTRLLEDIGYTISRQHGSHIRVEATFAKGVHRLTIPDHDVVKIGTLNAILAEVANAAGLTKGELATRLFG